MSAPNSSGTPAAFPSKLGDFQLLSPLGEGGSGQVYAARWGHREVALKVLHPTLVATPRERERFFGEARLLSEIAHPGVVKVLGFGALPDGRPYLAMEKLDGDTLAVRLGRGRLALGESLALFGQLARAVDALHARGLVHRDLKPENVVLVQNGGFAVLLDFGIAKELDSPASTVTQDGGVRGTPAYMAPERFFGRPATPQSDIYELAVLFYGMLVGALPWDDVADPEARLNPRTPSERGVALPGQLETVIARALSTRPEARPTSAGAFLQQVEAALGAVPGERQTASAGSSAAPRLTADVGSAGTQPASQPPPAITPSGHATPYGWGPQQPTPAGYAPPAGYVQTPGATTTGQTAPRGKRWPWIVGGLAIVAVAAVIVVFALQTGSGSEKLASAGAPAGGASATAGGQALAPTPLSTSATVAHPPASAATSGLADIARHHPADTRFLVAVDVHALLASESFGDVLRQQKDNPQAAPLLLMGQLCKVDPFADIDAMSLGIAGKNQDQYDVTISGRFNRGAIESCVGTMVDGSSKTWIDDHTLFVTNRPDVDAAWLAARVSGDHSYADAAGTDLRKVDRTATIWFAGLPGDAFGEVGPGFPAPRGAHGDVTVGSEVDINIFVSYAAARDAARAAAEAKKQLADVPEGLIGTLRAEQEGEELHVVVRMNALVTTMLAKQLAAELAPAGAP